jgi:hypothetical protein
MRIPTEAERFQCHLYKSHLEKSYVACNLKAYELQRADGRPSSGYRGEGQFHCQSPYKTQRESQQMAGPHPATEGKGGSTAKDCATLT